MDYVVQLFQTALLPCPHPTEGYNSILVSDKENMRLFSISTRTTHHLVVDYESVCWLEDHHESDVGSIYALGKSCGAGHYLRLSPVPQVEVVSFGISRLPQVAVIYCTLVLNCEAFCVCLGVEKYKHAFFISQTSFQSRNQAAQRLICCDGVDRDYMDSDLWAVRRRPDLDDVLGLEAKWLDEELQTTRWYGGRQEDDLHTDATKLLCQKFPFDGTIGMAIDYVVKFVHKDPLERSSEGGGQETVKNR